MQLSRKRIIGAAIELIEAAGVEAVTMPRLATELGCGVISLYNYIPSKSALLDGVADEVMSGIAEHSMSAASWQDKVRAQARAFREIARARPRCAMVAMSRRPTSASRLRPAELALATLREAGISGTDAVRIVRAITAYIAGSLLHEVGVTPGLTDRDDDTGAAPRLRPGEFPQLTELYPELQASDPDGDFEFGLDLLVRAVTARVSCGSR
jgi:AcrR family transcriptional regulator